MELVFNVVVSLALFALWIKNSYVENELQDLKDDLGVWVMWKWLNKEIDERIPLAIGGVLFFTLFILIALGYWSN